MEENSTSAASTVINSLFSIGAGVVMLIFAWASFNSYRGEGIDDLQSMLDDSTSTIAVMDSMYEQVTSKRGLIEYYNITCIYSVDDKEYRTKLSIDENPESEDFMPIFRIYYLKSDPSVISRDPEGDIAKKIENKGSWFMLLLAIVLGPIGALMLLSAIRKLKNV